MLKGEGPLRVSLGGPYGPPAIDAQISLENAQIAGLPLGNVDSRVLFRDGHTLEFPDAVVTYGDTQADGVAAVDLTHGPTVTASGTVVHGDVANLHSLLPLPPQLLDGLNGDVSGEFKVSGLAAAPLAEISFRSDGFEMVGQPFGSAQGKVILERGQFARMQASASVGKTGTATLAIEGEREGVSLDLDLDNISVSELRFLQGARHNLGGVLAGSGSGSWGKHPLGEANLTIDHLSIAEHPEGSLAIALALDGDHLSADFSGFDGKASGHGLIDIGRTPSFSVVARVGAGRADAGAPAVSLTKFIPLPEGYQFFAAATLDLHGKFSSLDTLAGSLDISEMRVRTNNFELTQKNSSRLVLRNHNITTDEVEA